MFDLRLKLLSTSEEIAHSVSAQGVGMFVGALLAGISVDAMGQWKFMLVTVATVGSSIVVMCMSYVASLTLLWITFFLLGTCAGIISVGKWQSRSIMFALTNLQSI